MIQKELWKYSINLMFQCITSLQTNYKRLLSTQKTGFRTMINVGVFIRGYATHVKNHGPDLPMRMASEFWTLTSDWNTKRLISDQQYYYYKQLRVRNKIKTLCYLAWPTLFFIQFIPEKIEKWCQKQPR